MLSVAGDLSCQFLSFLCPAIHLSKPLKAEIVMQVHKIIIQFKLQSELWFGFQRESLRLSNSLRRQTVFVKKHAKHEAQSSCYTFSLKFPTLHGFFVFDSILCVTEAICMSLRRACVRSHRYESLSMQLSGFIYTGLFLYSRHFSM